MTNKSAPLFLFIFFLSISLQAQDVLYLDKEQPAEKGSIQDLDWLDTGPDQD